jgi:CHAD domain-containing protein
MVRRNKWVEGVSPCEPVSRAARLALRVRFEPLLYYLPLAAAKSDRDIEYVHQLRVATRRVMAALEMYESLLPSRRARRLTKHIKKIRRAAGDARDLDVLAARLAKPSRNELSASERALVERVRRLRVEAQAPIRQVQERLKPRRFEKKVRALVRRARWRDSRRSEPVFAEAARDYLRAAVDPFFRIARLSTANTEMLHQLRIAGKQLRYSMELTAAAFPPGFRAELYPQIEIVQQRLGDVNDHASALARFRGWLEEWKEPAIAVRLGELAAEEEVSLAASRRAFLQSWDERRISALQQQFDRVLESRVTTSGDEQPFSSRELA